MKLVRKQKFYGYIYFEPCHFDYHLSINTKVKIFAGNQELIIRIIDLDVNGFIFFLI